MTTSPPVPPTEERWWLVQDYMTHEDRCKAHPDRVRNTGPCDCGYEGALDECRAALARAEPCQPSLPVLDHGSVTLLDVMGDDYEPARAARVSYNVFKSRSPSEDLRLTAYLHEHGHTSPFEMVELKWRVKCPLFVARQWLRHRTANVNEVSARYTEVDSEFYVPAHWRAQDKRNKQVSVTADRDFDEALTEDYLEACREAFRTYHRLLLAGVAREQARAVLPLSTYTSFVWKNDLHNTLHFLRLRAAPDAQYEIQQYATAMLGLLRERLPELMRVVWP